MTSASREQNSSAGEQLKMEHRVTAQSPPSDNDSGERPVRQQLKETNLDSVGENNGPARPNRKRSLDNTDGATDNPPTKRSRECTPDNLKASTEDKSNHAGIPKDATTQNVSNNVPATTPANTIPETKVQFPLVLELKVSIGGSEQITHMTIPVEIDIKLPGRLFSLTSSTARSAEGESSKTHVTGPSANPILPSGSPSPGHPSPPHNSPVHPSSGQAVSEYYAHEDPSFYIYEDPESIGDHSSEDSLPDYCSPGFLSSPPPPLSSTHPDYPIPTVEITGSNHSQYPQNLETTAGGNEDDSSQILKKKRSREQLEDDVSQNSHAATDSALGLDEATSSDEKRTTEGQPEKKRPRDNSEERKAKVDQTFTASAFGQSANAPSPFAIPATKSTSDASPFATTGASTTGFGALGSGFSAFGSPFSAPSGKLTSFASPNAPAAFSGTTGKLTSFASANAPASFSGTAGKLTSFASPNAPVSFGESNDKTLGAKQSDNEESDNEAAGEPDGTFVAEKTDERFHEQTGMDPFLKPTLRIPNMVSHSFQRENPVETGEENETTKFSAKGKLYYFDDKKWKERGIGTFKVNLKTESNGKKSGRMIMRADGALRVMLNSAIWHSMPFGDTKSARPATRDIYLASKEDEKVVSLLLRLGGEKSAQELYDVLKDTLEKI
ncbi:hypothetical protein N7517_005117 [Penicillium concentricum]|uniref:RanBD1 domain-containing protein n=1 Tax=Penicillium concentricum TaxID=293559 RepID=A0A9W9S6T6_9EURO|nr:uncharacterized protein N7517_005117 [Penicillium concentricum]KAJ5373111.1 hypothetical protein N7517_005117 [Penicillium concentricum]